MMEPEYDPVTRYVKVGDGLFVGPTNWTLSNRKFAAIIDNVLHVGSVGTDQRGLVTVYCLVRDFLPTSDSFYTYIRSTWSTNNDYGLDDGKGGVAWASAKDVTDVDHKPKWDSLRERVERYLDAEGRRGAILKAPPYKAPPPYIQSTEAAPLWVRNKNKDNNIKNPVPGEPRARTSPSPKQAPPDGKGAPLRSVPKSLLERITDRITAVAVAGHIATTNKSAVTSIDAIDAIDAPCIAMLMTAAAALSALSPAEIGAALSGASTGAAADAIAAIDAGCLAKLTAASIALSSLSMTEIAVMIATGTAMIPANGLAALGALGTAVKQQQQQQREGPVQGQ